jgi:hypothetical protein
LKIKGFILDSLGSEDAPDGKRKGVQWWPGPNTFWQLFGAIRHLAMQAVERA